MIALAKLLIIILCALLQFQIYPVDAPGIAFLLIALILTSIPLVVKTDLLDARGLHIVSTICWSGYLVCAWFVPELRCHLPLAIMDIFGLKLIVPGIISIVCVVLVGIDGLFVLLLSAMAAFLQYVITAHETLAAEHKKLRDNSKEHALLIEEKNRRLIEKQDAEIYAATLKERNRIAREIHDNVGHMLTRSILQVGAIKTINQNETLREPLEGLHETLNTAMTNIRSSVHDLHDESVDLHSAIREIIEPVDTVTIKLDYDMGAHVPRNIKYCFISITKEAVNNMLKHSDATQMNIVMQEHPAFYQLLIHDNGTQASANPTDGIGLAGMKDRVRNLNGNIKISTEQGFKILISIIKDRS